MRTPTRDARAQALFLSLSALGIVLGGLALARFYLAPTRHLASSLDVWFGADLVRHVEWIFVPASISGVQLHPGSFVLFKLYGAILGLLGRPFSRSDLGLAALPVLLSAAWALPRAALSTSGGRASRAWCFLLLALAIGPGLVFLPWPESHALGGLALFLAGAAVLRARRATESPGGESNMYRSSREAVFAAAGASLLTVSNLLPAMLLLLALPATARARWRRRIVLFALALSLFVIAGAMARQAGRGPLAWDRLWATELRYARAPSWSGLGTSFVELLTMQFGVPVPRLQVFSGSGPVDWVYRTYPAHRGLLASWLALSLAATAIGLRLRRRTSGSGDKTVVWACLAALASVVGIHACYATWEAYLFASHAWPLVVLPLWIVLGSDRSTHAERILIVGAVLLSIGASVVGLGHLARLLPYL